MNKKLPVSMLLCFFVFLLGILAKETDTEQKQTDVDKTKIVEEWQTNPEAFAKLIFGDDLSVRSSRKEATVVREKSIMDKVKGSYVEWPLTFGINPMWLGMSERSRRTFSSITDNMAIYTLIGSKMSGWIGLLTGYRHEGTQKIVWRQMTGGIPPQSDVLLKMKLKSVAPIIMKDGMLLIYVDGIELEIETSSKRCNWPEYSSEISGHLGTRYEVRVTSELEFPVKVGLRSDDKGKDFIVPKKEGASIRVPGGKYDVYFQYAADPESLYQGDSLDVSGSGVKIQLKGEGAGDYKIRKIK